MRTSRVISLLSAMLIAMVALAARPDTTVYFVNVYPGPAIYELEGHSAIMVDTGNGTPLVYNYGVFDFDAPNFVYRFVSGQTDYIVAAYPFEYFVDSYRRQGRRVVARELDMNPEQKAALTSYLANNILPQNRTYRYNYVKDNCATRPLRIVELAMGDSILLAPAPFEANSSLQPTFRNVMRLYHRNYPWYQLGIDVALGCGIDYTLSRRELAFAPAELDIMLQNAKAGDKPLVKNTLVITDFAPDAGIEGPTPWYLHPFTIFSAVFILAACLTVRDIRRKSVTRWFDAAFFGLLGIAGLILTFLIFISVHEATSPNLLYFWLNPLCLLVPALIWLKKCKGFLIWYQIVNFAVLIALSALWAWLPQSGNPAFIPLIGAELIRSGSYIYINIRK